MSRLKALLLQVAGGQVFQRLHFQQTAPGAFEFLYQSGTNVEAANRGCGGNDQVDAPVIELVHEGDEAARGVIAGFVELGNPGKNDSLEGAGNLDVVFRAARSVTKRGEVKPDDSVIYMFLR
jgi:hypothetical protein